MEEKKSLKERCKEGWNRHKKTVIIIGGVVVVVAGGYILVKNWDDICKLFAKNAVNLEVVVPALSQVEKNNDSITEPTLEIVGSVKEVPVIAHRMKLAAGKHASEEAKALAAELEIVLDEGYTVRRATTRHIAA